jgi:predicted transcriptional regulator
MSGRGQRVHTFGVRLDDATIDKLQSLANQTDRTRGSVIRLLIQLAEVGSIREVCLPSVDPHNAQEQTGREADGG